MSAMDSSDKKVAIVAETVIGTINATPAFLVLRDESTVGNLTAPFGESPERSNDRMLRSTYKQVHTLPKKISMPFAPDAALDVLLAAALMGTWATNALKNASTIQSFTIEEVFGAPTATPGPWLRSKGVSVDQMSLNFDLNKDGELVFSCMGLTEATDTAAITGATYAAPTQYEPITPIDVVVNSFCGLTPKMQSMAFTLKNNLRQIYNWGSADVAKNGLGSFRVDVQAVFYFESLAQYTALTAGTLGVLDITCGGISGHKYQIVLPNVKISNPQLSDPGNDGDVTLTCSLSALYDTATTAAITIARLVA
jgi:hypothetical protein